MTDDLKNCFPVTDRVVQYHSLPSLSSPSRRLGRVSDFKCHRQLPTEAFTPVALACFPLPPGAAGSQPVSQVHLGGASRGCIFTVNQCEMHPRARGIRASCPPGSVNVLA